MASTNKTTNYELSQYVGSDKPSYLNDYNQDMSKIDLGIHAAKSEADTNATAIGTLSSLTTTDKSDLVSALNEVDSNADTANATAVQADGKADTNATNIGTLANLTTTAKTDLVSATNEVNGKVGTLTNLETTSKTNVVSAINEVDENIKKFNLSNVQTIAYSGMTITNGSLSSGTFYLAKNSDDSIYKFYGTVTATLSGTSGTVTVPVTLSVDSSYTINCAGLKVALVSGGAVTYVNGVDMVVSNNAITINTNGLADSTIVLIFNPVLYFNKNFGDQPTPQ